MWIYCLIFLFNLIFKLFLDDCIFYGSNLRIIKLNLLTNNKVKKGDQSRKGIIMGNGFKIHTKNLI